jgi:ParB family chromosome partitioning protein
MLEIQNIELVLLHESTNPRTTFDKDSLKELTESIKEKGILEPLLVRSNNDGFLIVAGSRRYRGAKAAGLKEVPCIVKTLTDSEAFEIQLIENMHRDDLHPLDEAETYQRLQKDFGYSIDQLATKTGKSDRHVQIRLKFCALIEPVKKLFRELKISQAHALQVCRLQPEQQKECLDYLKRGDSAHSLADSIERHFFLNLAEAPFDTKDAKLEPSAGSCLACPKRTGANKLLFADIKGNDTCTDPTCYDSKVEALVAIQVAKFPDAIKLTLGSSYGEKPIATTEWTPAKDKNCANLKQGIIVQKLDYYGDWAGGRTAKVGDVLTVCVNPKCKTHRYVSDGGSSNSAWRKEQNVKIKSRRLELRRRGLIFKELASDPIKVSEKDYRAILDWQIRTLSHDHAKAVCDALAWEPTSSKYGGKDFQGTIEKNLAKLNADGVEQWMCLLMLADSELWFSTSSTPKATLLEAKAKAEDVSLAEIAKLAKEKQIKPKAKEAKPKK